MPRDAYEDYEAAIERILERNGAATPEPATPVRSRLAHGIAGWWVLLFIAGGVVAVAFDPPGFFPAYFLACAVTMPVFVLAAVIARNPLSVRPSWGGRRLPRV